MTVQIDEKAHFFVKKSDLKRNDQILVVGLAIVTM